MVFYVVVSFIQEQMVVVEDEAQGFCHHHGLGEAWKQAGLVAGGSS